MTAKRAADLSLGNELLKTQHIKNIHSPGCVFNKNLIGCMAGPALPGIPQTQEIAGTSLRWDGRALHRDLLPPVGCGAENCWWRSCYEYCKGGLAEVGCWRAVCAQLTGPPRAAAGLRGWLGCRLNQRVRLCFDCYRDTKSTGVVPVVWNGRYAMLILGDSDHRLESSRWTGGLASR